MIYIRMYIFINFVVILMYISFAFEASAKNAEYSGRKSVKAEDIIEAIKTEE